jgi:hypothetical protein
MIAEQFRTVLPVKRANFEVSFLNHLLFIGSCFSESIGNKLKTRRFNLCVNPNGIVYHPNAIAQSLTRLLLESPYLESELRFQDDKWFSFAHHGSFSGPDKHKCLEQIASHYTLAQQTLRSTDMLFITFGTAFSYVLKENGNTVANCHKVPQQAFTKKRSTVAELLTTYESLIAQLLALRPDLRIVFSVSPVRHLREGLEEDRLSKSILRLAVQELVERHACCSYFPAYELLQDDLRDYRFYNNDFTHPTPLAVDYIWAYFVNTFVANDALPLMKEIEQLNQAMAHRGLHPDTQKHQQFLAKTAQKKETLMRNHPYLNWK